MKLAEALNAYENGIGSLASSAPCHGNLEVSRYAGFFEKVKIIISLHCQTIRDMKRYKVKQVIDLLRKDGWTIKNWKGDHRQLTNPKKAGKVTVNGKESDTVSQSNLNSIWKQAGWK